MRWAAIVIAIFVFLPASRAEDIGKATETYQIPYRLTNTKHVLVRAKINGKGPFNFIIDTGAPALFVATRVCKQLGVEADAGGWGTFDRFEIEGGAIIAKAKARVEDPFQLEGMNGMGLAGAELHGIIGYTVLARYKLEFDFTRDKMAWTRLRFEPPAPIGLTGGRGGAPGGLDALGGFMKGMGKLFGQKAEPDQVPRGFLGLELEEKNGALTVREVLPKSPAAEAGVLKGDVLKRFQEKDVASLADVQKLAEKLTAGDTVEMVLARKDAPKTIQFLAGKGF